MIRGRRLSAPASGRSGFTVVELLVYFTLAFVVITAVYQLIIGQNRLYMKQRELIDMRGNLKAAAALLASELKPLSASGGDVYSVGKNSLAVRAVQASGVVCATRKSQGRYAIYRSTGEFGGTSNDSVMIYGTRGPGVADDGWVMTRVIRVWDPVGGGLPTCAWVVPALTDLVLEVASLDTSAVQVGAAVRAYRRIEYGLYQDGGRWWLGRKVGAAGSYELLTGPLAADGGLEFIYYDQAGNLTADPTQVALVEIVLRGESYQKVRRRGLPAAVQRDTLRTRVTLRG